MGRSSEAQPVQLDPRYFEHRKISGLNIYARELHLRAICFANLNLSDGYIEHETLVGLSQPNGLLRPAEVGDQLILSVGKGKPVTYVTGDWAITQLVRSGLLEEAPHGYVLHDYADYQPTRADLLAALEIVEDQREKASARKHRWRVRNRERSPVDKGNVPLERSTVLLQTGSSKALGLPTATATDSGALLGNTNNEEPLNWTTVVGRLKDGDTRTPVVILSVRRKWHLPDAALYSALDALEVRRQKPPLLSSEARYFVATLNGIGESGQYA